jgi:hypothetical protein
VFIKFIEIKLKIKPKLLRGSKRNNENKFKFYTGKSFIIKKVTIMTKIARKAREEAKYEDSNS